MRANHKLLSIIVPVYNVEDYIEECLCSILPQLNNEIELIIINDGTKDDSFKKALAICRLHENVIFIEQENKGLSATRNTGIKEATGQYIFFIDSDDYIKESSLHIILDIIKNNNMNDVSVYSIGYEELGEKPVRTEKEMNLHYQHHENDVKSALKKIKNPLSGAWRYIVRRELLVECGIFFREGMLCEDIEWSTKIFLKTNDIVTIDTKIYVYRINRENSIMNIMSSKRIHHAFEGIVSAYDAIVSDEKKDTQLKNRLEKYLFQQVIYNLSFLEFISYDTKYTKAGLHYLLGKVMKYQNWYMKPVFNMVCIDIIAKFLYRIKVIKRMLVG